MKKYFILPFVFLIGMFAGSVAAVTTISIIADISPQDLLQIVQTQDDQTSDSSAPFSSAISEQKPDPVYPPQAY